VSCAKTGRVLEFREGHGLQVFLLELVIVKDVHMWLYGWEGLCLFALSFCILRFRLFSCHLLLGYNGVAKVWSMCVCVGVRKALGLLHMASSEAMDGDEAFQNFVRRCAGCWAWL